MTMSEFERREVTQEGKDKLLKKLAYLKGPRQAEMAEKLNIARSYGDLSENAEWDAAKNEQAALAAEIADLENIIRNLVVVESVAGSATTAGIGSVVDVEYIEDSEKETYTLTSALESDPMSGKISIESPVGKAIAGHEAGDTVSVMLPDDDHFQIRIVSVTHE